MKLVYIWKVIIESGALTSGEGTELQLQNLPETPKLNTN